MNQSELQLEPTRLPLVLRRAGHIEIEILVAAIRRLSVAKFMSEVMEVVTPVTRRMLGAEGTTFILRDGDLCHYADEDAISPLWKGRRFPMSSCISGWCMTERRSVAIGDIYQDDRIPHDAYRPTFARSLAMVPIRKLDPIGAMGAYWSIERDVSRDELDLLQTLADVSALAIANTQLLQARRSTAEALETEAAHELNHAPSDRATQMRAGLSPSMNPGRENALLIELANNLQAAACYVDALHSTAQASNGDPAASPKLFGKAAAVLSRAINAYRQLRF
jgi:hypothetical protein